jgi:hypothetical protein
MLGKVGVERIPRPLAKNVHATRRMQRLHDWMRRFGAVGQPFPQARAALPGPAAPCETHLMGIFYPIEGRRLRSRPLHRASIP